MGLGCVEAGPLACTLGFLAVRGSVLAMPLERVSCPGSQFSAWLSLGLGSVFQFPLRKLGTWGSSQF